MADQNVYYSLFITNTMTFITLLERRKSRDKIIKFYFPLKRTNNKEL